MSNIDKRALREAAEKATPGRIGDRIDGSGSIKYQCFGNDGSLVLQTDHKNMEYGFIGGNSEADELFFRLCDPATVLALLDELEAAEKRIADLEATASEPVAFRSKLKASSAAGCGHWDYTDHRQPDAFELENCVIERLYAAPPAPTNAEPVAWLWSHRKHPSEVSLVRPEDDERAEGAHWSGWSCQALYAAPPAPVSDSLLSELLAIAKKAADAADECAHAEWSDDSMEHSTAISDWERRAAMLQGADGNSPVIPDGWVIVPVDMSPEMMRAVQINSELGAYSATNLTGAYSLFREFWDVAIASAPLQEVKP